MGRTRRIHKNKTLGQKMFNDYLKQTSFSLAEIALATGLHISEVSLLLSGRRRPNVETANMLKLVCNIPMEAWVMK